MTRPGFIALCISLAVGLLLVTACSDSTKDSEPLTLGALEAHWKATSLTYVNLADPSQSLEMVSTGEQSVDLTIADSTYLRVDTFFTPRFAVIRDSGRLELAGSALDWLSASEDTTTVGAVLANGRLTLADTMDLRLLCAANTCPILIRTRFRRTGR